MKFKQKKILKCLFLGIVLVLDGCSLLGPNYQQPKLAIPEHWDNIRDNNIQVTSANLSEITWWKNFNDPVLNLLINQALENNNDIQIAIGNIITAKGSLQKVNMAWVPIINLGGSAAVGQLLNFSSGSNNPPFNNIGSNSNFNSYSVGLVPSYSLNIFQQLKRKEIAQSNLMQAKYAKDAMRLTIISQVVGSYFTLLSLDKQLHLQKQIIADMEELVKLTRVQYKYGIATLLDVQQLESQLQQAKIQIPTLENNIVIVENAIQILINKNQNIAIRGNNIKFANLKTSDIIPINLPSIVLRNRPDIMQAEEQLKMANANIGEATSNFFPSIVLTTPVGAFNAQVSNLFNATGDFWTAQITAVMPILNLGLYGQIKEAKGKYYVAYYNYIKTVRTAFAEVNNNLSGFMKIKQSYVEAAKLYSISKSSYDLSLINYKNGYVSYPETLSGRLAMDNAEITLMQLKLQELNALVNIYQALAGGYNYNNTNDAKRFYDNHDA